MMEHLSKEERWNVYTHGFGAILSLIAFLSFLIFDSVDTQEALIGFLIYGFSLLFLFSASTIYHASSKVHQVFWQKIDHIGIYILIAGSYTPVTLSVLKESSGIPMLIAIWSIALVGAIYKLFLIGRFKNFSLFLYLGMGWLVVFDSENVYNLFPHEALVWLVLGGFFYTFGTIFYKLERLYFSHVIWHLFVLMGAASHFIMIVLLIF
jgi:hemolysin III